MNKEKSYSIILPTLNEEGHIKDLIFDIFNIFRIYKYLFEVIVIDDNSTDNTISIIKKIQNINSNVRFVVRKNKKRSLVDSLNDGIKLSKYKNIIWMDADYSHPPKYLSFFLNTDFDVISFSRFLKESKRHFHKNVFKLKPIDLLSIIINKICNILLFKDFTDYTSGYICIKKKRLNNFKLKGYYGDYFIDLIFHCKISGFKIKELPYTERDRASGFSKTTGSKLDFIVKCYFYVFIVIKSLLKKYYIEPK